MYVACARLKLKDRTAMPGDPVPEALHWSESVLRAHINLCWIKEVPDETSGAEAKDGPRMEPPQTTKKAKKNKKA